MPKLIEHQSVDEKELFEESVDYFVSFVQMFGLQKSVGQIYGMLFVTEEPVTMDWIISALGISKGSASQGLALLKGVGAVTSHSIEGDRREHFEADLNVSRIVTHFFEERLTPRLSHGDEKLARMLHLADVEGKESGAIMARLLALRKWQNRGRSLIPRLLKWL